MNVTVHMAEAQADQARKLPRRGFVHLLCWAGIRDSRKERNHII